MIIALFEDSLADNFWPLAETRPVYFLTCGLVTLAEKTLNRLPQGRLAFFCRPYLKEAAAEIGREILPGRKLAVNSRPAKDCLLINGRLLASGLSPVLLKQWAKNKKEKIWLAGNRVLAAYLAGPTLKKIFSQTFLADPAAALKNIAGLPRQKAKAQLLEHNWELIHLNSSEIAADARAFLGRRTKAPRAVKVHPKASLIKKEDIHLGPGCRIQAGAVLDAARGPIIIAAGALVEANAVIYGPACLGAASSLKANATIYGGTTIGPGCRVGGEINQSVISGFSNKAHYGYLGHSYLGRWCNLGAGTTNSNLKNNYQPVKVWEKGRLVKSGQQFLGLVMGDYTKTAIGTLFNTGSVVGVGCNVFGSASPPKFWPNFSWGDPDKQTVYKLHDLVKTNELMMKRRRKKMTAAQKRLLAYLRRQAG